VTGLNESQRRWAARLASLGCLLGCLFGAGGRLYAQQDRPRSWPWERTVGPFLLHADFPVGDTAAESIVGEIVSLRDSLAKATNLPLPGDRVYFFFFSTDHNYRRYLQRWFPDAPQRPALYIKGRGPGMVFAVADRDFRVDLRHETTHALLHSALPAVPLWLDEGLAEYFERAPSERYNGHSHLRRLRMNLFLHQHVTLEKLESLRTAADMGDREYRFAWAWTHLLLHGPEPARTALVEMIDDLGRQRPITPISQRLKAFDDDADALFREHWRRTP